MYRILFQQQNSQIEKNAIDFYLNIIKIEDYTIVVK